MAPTVFTYEDPQIDYSTTGIKFSGKCNDESTFVFKTRVISIDRRADEILLFLTDNQIIQLVGLKAVRDTYDAIILWLSS
jgi:hypothetical protein